jgi:hypothetical protein
MHNSCPGAAVAVAVVVVAAATVALVVVVVVVMTVGKIHIGVPNRLLNK